MGEILKMTAFLVLVCVVSAAALSFTDSRTRPLIEEQKKEREAAADREVLPGATEFTPIEGLGEGYYAGLDSEGKIVGYVGKAKARGFGGDVEVVAGMDAAGKVTGVKVLSHNETPGLGTNAVDPEKPVIKSMLGRGAAGMALKKDGNRDGVDAITGVTITSRAVTEAVGSILKALDRRADAEKR